MKKSLEEEDDIDSQSDDGESIEDANGPERISLDLASNTSGNKSRRERLQVCIFV